MQNLKNTGSAEVWSAAQYRRTEDIEKWFKEPTSTWRMLPRVALIGEGFASYAFLVVALSGVGLLCSGLLALAFI